MSKILFVPFSLAGGFAAGMVANRVFEHVWARIDDQEPPEATHRDADWQKVLLAAALQGVVFRVTRTAADRGARQMFASLTGTWPGEEEPDPEP